MRVAFFTLGCKLNQSESEALASSLASRGFFLVEWTEKADLYVVNTCTVTSKSEQKARRIIRKLSRDRPDTAVLVTGCYAQLDPGALDEIGENVVVLAHEDKDTILDLPGSMDPDAIISGVSPAELRALLAGLRERREAGQGTFRYAIDDYTYHSRPFLKIQDGCDNRCAYCRVPLARGGSISLDAATAVERLRKYEAKGCREVVLTGVNISAYHDLSAGIRLPGLIHGLIESTESVRIRLSSIEPDAVDESLARAVADPRVCPHFHLPVQSGSTRVLRLMARKYAADKVREAVELLRGIKEDPFIAGDFIVGFPGETEEDFELSRGLIREIGFSRLHVFPFSPRPGTAAYTARPKVPERISGIRSEELRKLSDELLRDYMDRWIGRRTEMILEEEVETDTDGSAVWRGTTMNYLQLSVAVPPGENLRKGGGVAVEIVDGKSARFAGRP
ncbi:MAG: tRNA (N(6)-L-threonylcarbamoyladenosine(37)-C(2))-methylthiotransferase MtaB [Spirochaetia bacterium]